MPRAKQRNNFSKHLNKKLLMCRSSTHNCKCLWPVPNIQLCQPAKNAKLHKSRPLSLACTLMNRTHMQYLCLIRFNCRTLAACTITPDKEHRNSPVGQKCEGLTTLYTQRSARQAAKTSLPPHMQPTQPQRRHGAFTYRKKQHSMSWDC